jgi:diguanylate cyclase (GGDEF)-like protein
MTTSSKKQTEHTLQIDRSTIAEQMRDSRRQGRRSCFVVLGGLDVGRVLDIKDGISFAGRDPACELMLRDDGISRRHVEINKVAPDAIFIRDLGSTNGTFVAGERVESATLRDGDKVLLGRRTVLKFSLADEIEDSYQRQMYESATRDGLTGVFNRKYFDQKLVGDLSFARRHGLSVSLLIFDIDHFKNINDTHGHRTGDLVLEEVCAAVGAALRAEDVLARYGGEEFAIIALGTDFDGIGALGERVRRCVENLEMQSLAEPPRSVKVTVSVGGSTASPTSGATAEQLIGHVDRNLYEAKDAGRNRIVTRSYP